MRALMCHEFGPPETLRLETVPALPLPPDGVRVAVKAAGVNFPDTLIIQGKYQVKPPFPFAPGGELAGVVLECGPEARRFRPGQRVVGVTLHGAFADEIVATEDRLRVLPDGIDFTVGAAFSMTYGTSLHALAQRGRLQPGETLLVLGASGGVGLAAVEIGKLMGARVLAAGGDDAKLEVARAHGADAVTNYAREGLRDAVRAFAGGGGVDVIYDAVGGDLGEQAVRCLAWKGRLLVVGFAAGRIPSYPANLLLLKGAEAVGVFWGDFRRREPEAEDANFERLFAWLAAGKLRPHIAQTYTLDRASEALEALMQRRAVGKLVVVP